MPVRPLPSSGIVPPGPPRIGRPIAIGRPGCPSCRATDTIRPTRAKVTSRLPVFVTRQHDHSRDLYTVLCATAPLYTAMLSPTPRCGGGAPSPRRSARALTASSRRSPSRPLFHFIAHNDPYRMDLRFLLADTLAKLLALALVAAVSSASAFFAPRLRRGAQRLDWPITVFSVATLPNTLVMGIPLLRAMYGDFTQPLMVHLVVLQYTLLLILFEYRAAALLIREAVPGRRCVGHRENRRRRRRHLPRRA
uniref:Uncharacterized protein n=1 Tax=Ananas comosus var. bracteatus TaxID=296719 RepID=A0A6V7NHU0_ANACO|nr:unnamed protein product [Ananas comosus var. bracteatus]